MLDLYLVKDSKGVAVSLRAAIIHISPMSHAKRGNPHYYIPLGVLADTVIEAMVEFSGSSVPVPQLDRVLNSFTPTSGSADPRWLTKTLVQCRRQEKESRRVYTRDDLPPDVLRLADSADLFTPLAGEEKRTPVLTHCSPRGHAGMSEDKKEHHQANLKLARARRTPAQKAEAATKSAATPAAAGGAAAGAAARADAIAQLSEHDQAWRLLPKELKPPSSHSFVSYQISQHSTFPKYRIDLQDVVFYPSEPVISPVLGRVCSADTWAIVASNLLSAYNNSISTKKYTTPDTLETEPFYCQERDLLFLSTCVRTPDNSFKLSSSNLLCPACKGGDMGAGKAKRAKAAPLKPCQACGPVLAFQRILHPKKDYSVASRRGPCAHLSTKMPFLNFCIVDRTSVPPLSSTVQANCPAEYAYHPVAVRLRQELRTANIIQTKKAKILDEILLMTLAGLADPTISAEDAAEYFEDV
ncbi:uncharacterized protein MKK02DRAFT_27762 [Dioszegia hungarica]|uniref:Uncharacterized protein n=1 Tax=Dioszegia hungarica TaxID=4972 RepID=A0AA38H529_9TREE|nr:uncharacterized protein MKK02DRAFT_27762 [Dioszegia hungarica]KAI9634562.1 hypothetical protein MKK02DRAFT_27762 [Dioszegia hungarica]